MRKVVVIGTGPGGNPETDPHTDIVFGIALTPEYSFDDVRYLFFAEGRDIETQAYIDRNALRADREPVVTPEVIQVMAGLIMEFMGGKTGHYARLGSFASRHSSSTGTPTRSSRSRTSGCSIGSCPTYSWPFIRRPATRRINSTRKPWPPRSSGSSPTRDLPRRARLSAPRVSLEGTR